MAVTNPFNLRPSGDNWLGMTGTSNNFLEFANPTFGLRAGFRNMANQKNLHNIDTIDDYINKYAPVSDNSTASVENYKQMLEGALGVSRTDQIDLSDPDTMLKIGKAQIQMEQGDNPYSDALLRNVIAQAFNPNFNPLQDTATKMINNINDRNQMYQDALNQSGYVKPKTSNIAVQRADMAKAQQLRDLRNIPSFTPFTTDPEIPSPPRKVNTGFVSSMQPNLNPAMENDAFDMVSPTIPQRPSMNLGFTSAVSPALNKAQQATAQTRKQTALSIPDPRIGTNEMLMRVGGAMMGASPQGGLAAYEAGLNQFGAIQDYNREVGLEAYKTAMEAQAKSGKTDKQKEDNTKQLNQVDAALFDFNRALEQLNDPNINATGLIAGTFGKAWDNIRGNPAAATRLLLNKLKVDDALLRIAQTKGAISNKEMDLFLSPAPSDLSDEEVWKTWIKDRIQALTVIRNRLATGETVGQGEMATNSQIDQFSTGVGSSFVAPNVGQSTTIDNVQVKRLN